MITLRKKRLLYLIKEVNENPGFLSQVQSDNDLLLTYCIRNHLIKVPKSRLDLRDVPDKDESIDWRHLHDQCVKYLSPKLLFLLKNNGMINVLNSKRSRIAAR